MKVYIDSEGSSREERIEKVKVITKLFEEKGIEYEINDYETFHRKIILGRTISTRNGIPSIEYKNGEIYIHNYEDAIRIINNKTCGSCKNFIGFGDWSLCCKIKHDLCYETTGACEKYEEGK